MDDDDDNNKLNNKRFLKKTILITELSWEEMDDHTDCILKHFNNFHTGISINLPSIIISSKNLIKKVFPNRKLRFELFLVLIVLN